MRNTRKRVKRSRHYLFLTLCVCIIVGVVFWIGSPVVNKNVLIGAMTEEISPQPATLIPQSETVSFIAAGDNLIHNSIYLQAAKRGKDTYDFDYAYEHVRGYFDNFDVKFINQETLVNDAFEASSYPAFSSPVDLGNKMIDMGFNVIGTSNNHSYDKGFKGLQASYQYWEESGVIHCGFYTGDDDKDIKYLTKNNIKLSFLAYTYGTNGLSIPNGSTPYVIYADDVSTIERQVKIAKENSDIVIVSMHWGAENTNMINEYQKNAAMQLNKMGVDVIIGTHPHVIQPVEEIINTENGYKTLVCYSLGNFISAQSKLNNMIGGLFQFDITKEYDTENHYEVRIENIYFVPIVTHYDGKYANIRNYLLKDYTQELANSHGVKNFDKRCSLEFMEKLVTDIIPSEYLLYDNKVKDKVL